MGSEIRAALASPQPSDGYRIRRVLYHLGHYYTRGLYPDGSCGCFAASARTSAGTNRTPGWWSRAPSAKLNAPILHFSYRDVADHVATINRLSSQAATEGDPGALTVVKMIANPAWRFFNFYFLRGGFREGGRGLYAAMSAAFYVFLKYAKLYERRLRTQRRL